MRIGTVMTMARLGTRSRSRMFGSRSIAAAAVSSWLTAMRKMGEVSKMGLANVLAQLPRPRRFLYISSSSAYGQTDGGWVDEDSPTEPQEKSGQVVLAAEEVLRARLPEAIVLRFSGIYGPGRLLRRQTIE